jgi:hypothetical protein
MDQYTFRGLGFGEPNVAAVLELARPRLVMRRLGAACGQSGWIAGANG